MVKRSVVIYTYLAATRRSIPGRPWYLAILAHHYLVFNNIGDNVSARKKNNINKLYDSSTDFLIFLLVSCFKQKDYMFVVFTILYKKKKVRLAGSLKVPCHWKFASALSLPLFCGPASTGCPNGYVSTVSSGFR